MGAKVSVGEGMGRFWSVASSLSSSPLRMTSATARLEPYMEPMEVSRSSPVQPESPEPMVNTKMMAMMMQSTKYVFLLCFSR